MLFRVLASLFCTVELLDSVSLSDRQTNDGSGDAVKRLRTAR